MDEDRAPFRQGFVLNMYGGTSLAQYQALYYCVLASLLAGDKAFLYYPSTERAVAGGPSRLHDGPT
jgi:hypothetical protein